MADTDVLGELARAHATHPLSPGLRQLADEFAHRALGLLFPHFSTRSFEGGVGLGEEVAALCGILERAVGNLGPSACEAGGARGVFAHLEERLGELRAALVLDAEAIHAGDPAAESIDEVILAYPGFLATAIHRIAHELYGRVAIFPRLLSEVAHSATGIDIHPGARIGASFAIDHGTGVVIGETSALGRGVRLYQGVTLGAARVSRRQVGVKRHPTIGDDVVIYANTTVLGGETVIGRGSRIGGNVFLTRSVPPYSVVMPSARVERRDGGPAPADDLLEFNI